METVELIKKFEEYFHTFEEDKIVNVQDITSYNISASTLMVFDPEILEQLFDEPEETIKAAELAFKDVYTKTLPDTFRIRIINLPESQFIRIRDIRKDNLNKFYCIEGIIRQASDIRPKVKMSRFECPSCGNITNVIQEGDKIKEPIKCVCGRKGKFRLLSTKMKDFQKLVLEEDLSMLEGTEQPKKMNVLLEDDLTSMDMDNRNTPGTKILINGIVKDIPVFARDGGVKLERDLVFEANFTEPREENFEKLELTNEDVIKIKELSKDPNVYQMFVDSYAPDIYGNDEIKKAIILQLFGGVKKMRGGEKIRRGDFHLLLIGDPGSGKSILLKQAQTIAPKVRFTSGKGTSGVGLTAATVRDEFMGGYVLEAGLLALANKGLAVIDELDKISSEHRDALHEPMEGQTIVIHKGNIHATLKAECSILSAANPKKGRFDPYEPIPPQIDMPISLLSRFDLLFIVKDIPERERDSKVIKTILAVHSDSKEVEPKIEHKFMRKYIAYARQMCHPKLSEDAMSRIEELYTNLRQYGNDGQSEKYKPIPITARQGDGLVRLSEAAAKITLSNNIESRHVDMAMDLLLYSLKQTGVDPETGKLDVDMLTLGTTASRRNKEDKILDIIDQLKNKLGDLIPLNDVVKEVVVAGIPERQAEEIIEKLRMRGDLFEPHPGFIKRL